MKKACPIFHPLLKLLGGALGLAIILTLLKTVGFQLNWGRLVLAPASTITVSGEASEEQLNQLASFSAEIETIAEDKETATQKTNQVMNDLIDELKAFGIDEKDLKSSRINVYQEDEYFEIAPAGGVKSNQVKKGDWRASTSLDIIVRSQNDETIADQAEAVLEILNQSEANYISGPNFRLDEDNEQNELELMSLAVADARQKAEAIAKGNQQKVGKIINLTEGYSSSPRMYDYLPMAAGGAEDMAVAKLEPGSSRVNKTVTITFELK